MIGLYEVLANDVTGRAIALLVLAVGVIGGWWTRRGTVRDD